MGLTLDFDSSFFTGTSISTEVPFRWDVSLDGYNFAVDWHHVDFVGLREGSYTVASTPVIRTQADTSAEPGEQSLNPEGPWRRSAESWHSGAGQTWQDRKESDPFRFDTSKGINPWKLYELSLLNDTALVAASGSTGQQLAVAGGLLFRTDGSTVHSSVDGSGWASTVLNATVTPGAVAAATSVPTVAPALPVSGGSATVHVNPVTAYAQVNAPQTSVPTPSAATITALATDGSNVYVGYGPSGIYTGNTAIQQWITSAVDLVRFCNGRVICADGPNLYNPTAGGQLPTPLAANVPASWTWTDAISGATFIYACGYAGTQSAIYSIGLATDASRLNAPQVAATLLPGEICRGLVNYQGFIVALLDQGVRFGQADPSSGALTFGALIPTPAPVRCGHTWDRFIWYGLTNYDTTSTGLGRLDPRTFTSDLTPAYASDVMATAQGTVTSSVMFRGKHYFAVDGVGVWRETNTPVTSGTLTSGRITYDLPDDKNALFLDLLHEPLNGTIDVHLAVEDSAPILIGSSITPSTVSSGELGAGQRAGRWFTHTVTLKPGSNISPVLSRVTLHVWAAPHRTRTISLPLLFNESVEVGGQVLPFDCAGAEAKIDSLLQEGRYVNFQSAQINTRVFVFDTNFIRLKMTTNRTGHQGTFVVMLREL
jgi:hypothetical protein